MATSIVSPAPTCHADRKVYAKGLCNSCYRKSRQRLKSEMATCHPDRTHHARGMCRNCYRAHIERSGPVERRQARWRRASLRYNFGISEAQHDAMRVAQGDACGMCRKPFGATFSDRPHDHCHSTNKVRGLLCMRCNVGLGQIEAHLDAARAYLASGYGI